MHAIKYVIFRRNCDSEMPNKTIYISFSALNADLLFEFTASSAKLKQYSILSTCYFWCLTFYFVLIALEHTSATMFQAFSHNKKNNHEQNVTSPHLAYSQEIKLHKTAHIIWNSLMYNTKDNQTSHNSQVNTK